MSKTVVCLLALLALVFVGSAFCLSGSQLSGDWTVTFANDAKYQNEMSFTYSDGNFSGTYINDSKDSCPVSGTLAEATGHLILHIKCPKWGIELEGTASSDGKTIKGDYNWPSGNGPFTMAKHESQ